MEIVNSGSYMRICCYDVERTIVSWQPGETWEMGGKIWCAEEWFLLMHFSGERIHEFLMHFLN